MQIRQSLQERLHLTDKDLLELLLLGAVGHVVDLLAALYEHLELLNQVSYLLDVAIILGLLHEVVDAEATRHDEHEALVQLGSNGEEALIVVGEIDAVVLGVKDHLSLLLPRQVRMIRSHQEPIIQLH